MQQTLRLVQNILRFKESKAILIPQIQAQEDYAQQKRSHREHKIMFKYKPTLSHTPHVAILFMGRQRRIRRNYRTGHPNAKISNKKHKHHRPASEHNDTHKSQRAHQAGKGWRESKVIHGLDVETTSIKMFDEGAELEAGCAGPGREGRGREQTRVKLPGVFEVGEERESTAEVQHLGEDGNGKSI
ncbi:hypothetical protein UCRPC4_g06117 [Phaeomoniella chlamydospora]|uniref:Uncharacterized protein n=1 Tax=Phaeomoniella chlamydospora TaxID=158046 RepID=A0A0G2DYZ8_PHACM|nr:hypothetical protein UCRPC4_g06117 [Phaeomoniella chlamydospora]